MYYECKFQDTRGPSSHPCRYSDRNSLHFQDSTGHCLDKPNLVDSKLLQSQSHKEYRPPVKGCHSGRNTTHSTTLNYSIRGNI